MTAIKSPTAKGRAHLIQKFFTLILSAGQTFGKQRAHACPECHAISIRMLELAGRLADLGFENDALRAKIQLLKGGAAW